MITQKGIVHLLPLFLIVAAVGVISFLLISSTTPSGGFFGRLYPKSASQAATSINGHPVLKDSSAKIMSWITPQNNAYDAVMRKPFEFLLTKPFPSGCSGGGSALPHYLMQSYIDPGSLAPSNWDNNPAGKHALIIESALNYYAYSGDSRVIDLAKELTDYQLDHGMTAGSDSWANVPYSTEDSCQTTFNGGGREGAGNLEPDKVGEFGVQALRLYQYTGNTRYRDAAINAATQLANHIKIGDASNSPWPHRVGAQNNSTVTNANYSAHVISPIQLFDELIRLNLGNVSSYQTARTTAWNWLMNFPIKNNIWDGYFEDVPSLSAGGNNNQYNPGETARYLMFNQSKDPNWETHVRGIISFIENRFGAFEDGGWSIKEQDRFANRMGSHTARYAADNAMLYELTGDQAAKEKAFRAFNWATYMMDSTTVNGKTYDGIVIDGPDVNGVWFTDGYGDFIRHFQWGMAAVPQWAPDNQTHILRSSSVVKSVQYSPLQLSYTTADNTATEVIRLAFVPSKVTVGGTDLASRSDLSQPGWIYNPSDQSLRIFHTTNGTIVVFADPNATPPPPTPTPLPTPVITPTPVPSGLQIIDFNAGPTGPLNNQYPSGVINWGSGNWLLSGPFGAFSTNSISFSNATITSTTLTFITPKRLIKLDGFNGATGTSTVTLSCAGQPTKQFNLSQQPIPLNTGWTGTCTTVTIASSNSWDTNFDNLTFDDGGIAPTPLPSTTPTPTAKLGDLDNDGDVDIFDYSTLVSNFGKTGTNILGDLDNDGDVDIFDYSTLVTNFGK